MFEQNIQKEMKQSEQAPKRVGGKQEERKDQSKSKLATNIFEQAIKKNEELAVSQLKKDSMISLRPAAKKILNNPFEQNIQKMKGQEE